MTAHFTTRYGPYAVVTGASAGIGEQFARQLAVRGLNLVLVARRKDRLQELADELSAVHRIDAVIVSADLLIDDAVELVNRETAELDIGLVVLNAGVAQTGPFLDTDLGAHTEMALLNGVRTMQLAHVFGRRLVARGGGGMVLVASLSGCAPTPYLAHYGATKAYLMSLGQSLSEEWRSVAVDVTVLSPGLVDTDMVRTSAMEPDRSPFPVTDTATVVSAALAGLGRRPVVIPGVASKLTDVVMTRVLPRQLTTRVLAELLGRLVGVR
jgi:short-subunit dehydrogenase